MSPGPETKGSTVCLTLFDEAVERVLVEAHGLLDPFRLGPDGSVDVQVHYPGRSRHHLGHVRGGEQLLQLAHLRAGRAPGRFARLGTAAQAQQEPQRRMQQGATGSRVPVKKAKENSGEQQ